MWKRKDKYAICLEGDVMTSYNNDCPIVYYYFL